MVIQFTLQDLMFVVIITFLIVLLILLLPILRNLKKVVGIIRPLVETNQRNIEKTFIAMPLVLENVGIVSNSVREISNVNRQQKEPGGFMAYLEIFKEVLQIISNTFSSNK